MKQFVQVLQKYQLTSISRPSLNFPKQSLETFFLRDVPHSNESSDFSSLLRLTLLTYTYTCRHPLHSRRTTRRPTHTSTSLLYSFSPHTHTHQRRCTRVDAHNCVVFTHTQDRSCCLRHLYLCIPKTDIFWALNYTQRLGVQNFPA